MNIEQRLKKATVMKDIIVGPIVDRCLSEDCRMDGFIGKLVPYLLYADISYYALKHFHATVATANNRSDIYYENLLNLLSKFLPLKMLEKFFAKTPHVKSELYKRMRVKPQRYLLCKTCVRLLQMDVPDWFLLRLLTDLGDNLLARCAHPALLADHLLPVFRCAREPLWSRVTLRAICLLVRRGGVDCPDLFSRVYQLIDERALLCPHAARFFADVDLIMTSVHMPKSLLACYVKRLSRLCLTAPLRYQPLLLTLVRNWLQRHPHARSLIQRSVSGTWPTKEQDADLVRTLGMSDPYNPDATTDLELTGAVASSLWELASLQQHYHPAVAAFARTFNSNLGRQEDPRPLQYWLDQQDKLINDSVEHMEKSLIVLANTNSQLPPLIPLEGWE